MKMVDLEFFQCSACYELLFEPIILPCSKICCKRCFRIPKLLNSNTATIGGTIGISGNMNATNAMNTSSGNTSTNTMNTNTSTNTMNTNTITTNTITNMESSSSNICPRQQIIGAYTCPSKDCSKTHRYRNESVLTSFSLLLKKLFPNEQSSLEKCKLGEELMRSRNWEFIVQEYFTPAIESCSHLQLPLLLRSKVYSEMKRFDLARMDSNRANELNKINKRGIVSEKLVNWCEQISSGDSKETTKRSTSWCEKVRKSSMMKNTCLITEMRDQLKLACSFSNCGSKENLSRKMLSQSIKIENVHLEDFECQLCLEPFNEPIATPCGHVYCRHCLFSSLDHSRCCPLCRCILPTIGYFINKPVLRVYEYFVKEYFKVQQQPQVVKIFEPCWVPIYQCPLLFPTTKTSLHISEQQYRVMIKRVIETSKKFGAMLPCSGEQEIEYGTMVEITQYEPLLSCDIIPTIDGNLPRYVVQVQGISRFKISSVRMTDAGYYEALCTRIEDLEYEGTSWDPKLLESLVQNCRQKIQALLSAIPTTARLHMDRKFGKMPSDPEEFSFWLGEILPLNHYVLYKILPMTRVEDRLMQLQAWLDAAMSCARNRGEAMDQD